LTVVRSIAQSITHDPSPITHQLSFAAAVVSAPEVIAAVATVVAAVAILTATTVSLIAAFAVLAFELIAAVPTIVAAIALPTTVVIALSAAAFVILAPEITAAIAIVVAAVALLSAPLCLDLCQRPTGAGRRKRTRGHARGEQLDRVAARRPAEQSRQVIESFTVQNSVLPRVCSRRATDCTSRTPGSAPFALLAPLRIPPAMPRDESKPLSGSGVAPGRGVARQWAAQLSSREKGS
jgi:hypothetical protein